MASAPHQAVMLQYLKMALQSGHGAAAAGLPLFEAAGINSIGSLTSFRPSFRNQSYDVTELKELESALRARSDASGQVPRLGRQSETRRPSSRRYSSQRMS